LTERQLIVDAGEIVDKIRVLLADDRKDVLDGIQDLLEPEFDVVGKVGDGQALVSAAETLKPDIIITDISMPHMEGIDAARTIIRNAPGSRIIVLSVHNDSVLVDRGLAAGILGYVLKIKASQELVQAIRQVLLGIRYVSPLAAQSRQSEGISSFQKTNTKCF
jgi:DNA-binding NarL/FixJ family response regulator